MSAAFFDYDNDGRLDIYSGNMWSRSGQRVTAQAAFMPDAPAEVRELYRRHARGNSLFRNRGDGGFEDVTLAARAEMGRWAWSSDALDFDSDGWEDLYVANGMLTRESGPEDLDGFFWRQVVARSPLTRVTGTPYDDAWRAINQLLIHSSIASHQRNVFLRNDGRGGFDDVSGTVGLDLDQDGRSFAVLDYDRDGDPGPRPHGRALRAAAPRVPERLRGARRGPRRLASSARAGNRDAVGARVTVETDLLRRTKIVQAGSGFLSQHSKELLFGLGASQRVVRAHGRVARRRTQVFTDVPSNHRLRSRREASPGRSRSGGCRPARRTPPLRSPRRRPSASWLYEPFPAPDFSLPDLRGEPRSLSALRGRPAVVLLWAAEAPASRAASWRSPRGPARSLRPASPAWPSPSTRPEDLPKVRAAASGVSDRARARSPARRSAAASRSSTAISS